MEVGGKRQRCYSKLDHVVFATFDPTRGYFLLNMSMIGVGMNFMTVSTMLSSSSSSPQPVGTAFFGRVRLPSEACSIAAAASASFSSFFLMPYCGGTEANREIRKL